MESIDLPALLDSAADASVIPEHVVDKLNLPQWGQLTVEGFGGNLVTGQTYMVHLEIRMLTPIALKVLAHRDNTYVLLGRDVLNRHRILLDGPELALEIE